MKIDSIKLRRGGNGPGKKYEVTATVSDGEHTQVVKIEGDDPQTAAMAAVSNACREIADKLVRTIRVNVEVTFES